MPFVFYMSELFLRLDVYFTATIATDLLQEQKQNLTCMEKKNKSVKSVNEVG